MSVAWCLCGAETLFATAWQMYRTPLDDAQQKFEMMSIISHVLRTPSYTV